MLNLDRVRRQPAPAVLALVVGLLFGVVFADIVQHDPAATARARAARGGDAAAKLPPLPASLRPKYNDPKAGDRAGSAAQPGATGAATSGSGPAPAPFQDALRRGVELALARYPGRAEAALWIDGWPRPLVAGDAGRRMRMWSMSKPVTAVAVRQALEATNQSSSAALEEAMTRAIRRSENCRQRRVVIGLQELTGSAANARLRFMDVLRQAHASANVPAQTAPPEAMCRTYLLSSGISDPLRQALQLGTATWRITDAVAFAHALADHAYGRAGDAVLALMRAPKQVSEELGSPDEYTVDEDWGAGRSFSAWHPAYKAGWGGSLHENFLAGQLVEMQVGAHRVAVAAAFHPAVEPSTDNPGATKAPQALETIFDALQPSLARLARAPR